MPPHIEEKIHHLRRTYQLGQRRIHWSLLRYHDIKVSSGALYYALKRNGMNRLPRNVRKHRVQRYEKQVPGDHVQMGWVVPIAGIYERNSHMNLL